MLNSQNSQKPNQIQLLSNRGSQVGTTTNGIPSELVFMMADDGRDDLLNLARAIIARNLRTPDLDS